MAGQKVGGASTHLSEKDRDAIFIQHHSFSLDTRLGQYQYQRNDVCYGSNAAPSRAGLPVWKNAPAPVELTGAGDTTFAEDVAAFGSGIRGQFLKVQQKVGGLINDLDDLYQGLLLKIDGAVGDVQLVRKMLQKLRELVADVAYSASRFLEGKMAGVLKVVEEILDEIEDFWEDTQAILRNFYRKPVRLMAEKAKEVERICRNGMERIQKKIVGLVSSVKSWVAKRPKMTKAMRALQKLGKFIDPPGLSCVIAFVEFVEAGEKFGSTSSEESRDEMYKQFINFIVECILSILVIVVLSFGGIIAVVVIVIVAVVGIADLLTGRDIVADWIYKQLNSYQKKLSATEQTLTNSRNKLKTPDLQVPVDTFMAQTISDAVNLRT